MYQQDPNLNLQFVYITVYTVLNFNCQLKNYLL